MEDQHTKPVSQAQAPTATLPVPPPPVVTQQLPAGNGVPSKKFPSWAWILIGVLGAFVLLFAVVIPLLIVTPRLATANRGAKEATLRAGLHQIRTAIEMFQADTGVYPASLNDLVAPSAQHLEKGILKTGRYLGPYLTSSGGVGDTGIPANPYAGDDVTIDHHWVYSSKDGRMHSAISGTTLDGISFEDL